MEDERRYGRLVIIADVKKRGERLRWKCQCDCGTVKTILAKDIKARKIHSCGCLKAEGNRVTHGAYKTREYRIWGAIKTRCANPNQLHWNSYGGRGIKICPQWAASFECFLKDVGHAPSDKHSIDRFPDPDGNYEPSNVRWATQVEQTRNTRVTRMITFNGKTQCVTDWAKELGLEKALKHRLYKGWSVEDALTFPVGKSNARSSKGISTEFSDEWLKESYKRKAQ